MLCGTMSAVSVAAMMMFAGEPAALGQGVGTGAPAAAAHEVREVRAVPTISASSSATESREPDQAELVLGVQATGKRSAEAMDSLNKRMDAVIAAVKGTNLPGLTTQTQQVSLYPQYEQPPMMPMGGEQRNQEPRIVGYVASNTVRVTVGDVRRSGGVIDAGVNAGANQIMGVSFSLKNDLDARRAAIRKATGEARAKAEAIAEALGVKLGKIVRAGTGSVESRPIPYMGRAMMEMKADAAAAPTPIEGGQVEVSAEVTVEFEIVQGG